MIYNNAKIFFNWWYVTKDSENWSCKVDYCLLYFCIPFLWLLIQVGCLQWNKNIVFLTTYPRKLFLQDPRASYPSSDFNSFRALKQIFICSIGMLATGSLNSFEFQSIGLLVVKYINKCRIPFFRLLSRCLYQFNDSSGFSSILKEKSKASWQANKFRYILRINL